MRTAAVLPVKSFGRAKSRLGERTDRPDLAAAMAADVLDALTRVDGLDDVLVVSREPLGPTWIRDDAEAGHVPAARLGVDAAVERGFQRVLLVPGDCPGLDPAEVDELLTGEGGRTPFSGVVVVPDRHGTGTNALPLAPPRAIEPSFGPGSFERHLAAARTAGVEVQVATPRSLLMDVDTPEDLEALLAELPPAAAPRTRALLAPVP